ncbi:MAG: purine/pyrimidine permease, partial [Eubacteriaceae bacterium]|nr:purine/pyrimidine permease [Eubacteriaceae bacterium]
MSGKQPSFIGINEKLSIGQALFLGLQSVLACNLFLGPVVIIGILAMDVEHATTLIAMTFLACGIATVIQSGIFLKYPIIQGMSFATIGAVLAIAAKSDFATVFGSLIISTIAIIIIGYLKLFSKIVKVLIPPLVAGTVIIVIGIALMPIVWSSLIVAPGNQSVNFLEAGISFLALLIFIYMGHNLKNRVGKIIRTGSVIYAMIIGTVFSSFFGNVNLAPVAAAKWFALPTLFPYGPPKFDMSAALIMTFILLVVLVESLGSWFTVSVLAGEKMTDKQIDKGVIGEGIGCLIGTFIGGIPVTSYGSNAGVIVVTRVLSRWAAVGAGAICIAMALCPKLMSLIAIIPPSVIWGVFGVICVLIMMSGFQSIREYPLNDRNSLV